MLKKYLFVFLLAFSCLTSNAQSEPIELINAGDGVALDFKQTNTWEYSNKDYKFEVGGTLIFNGIASENAQLKFLVGTKVIFNTVQLTSDTYEYELTEENVTNLSAGRKFVVQGRNFIFKTLYYQAPNGDGDGDDNGDDNGDNKEDDNYAYSGILMSDLNLSLSWSTDYKIVLNQKLSKGDVLQIDGISEGSGSPRFTFAYQTLDNYTWTELYTAEPGTSFSIDIKDSDLADAINELGFFVKGSDLLLTTISYKGNTSITEGGTVNGSAAGEGGDDNNDDVEGEEDLEGAFMSGVHFDDWNTPMVIIPASFFDDATENDFLRIYYSAPAGGQSGGKMQLAYNDKSIEDPSAQWTMITEGEKIRGEGAYTVPLKGIIDYLKQDGFFVKGNNFTFVKATLVRTTDVAEIEIENQPVFFYNLNGIQVENPSNGIFIRVQGKKINKVVIK